MPCNINAMPRVQARPGIGTAACLIAISAISSLPCRAPLFARPWSRAGRRSQLSKSCQAAALGFDPDPNELKKLDRALPQYMLDFFEGNEAKAMRRWVETLQWRCEIDDDGIFTRPNPDFFKIQRHFPTSIHLPDKAGRLTYWNRVGNWDSSGLDEDGLTIERIRDDYVWQTLFTWDIWLKRDDKQHLTIIMDMDGFRISQITPKLLRIFSASFNAVQAHMPDREHLVLVVNAPDWWRTVWSIFRPFLAKKQQERLRVCVGRDESFETLREFIDVKNLPEAYGGSGIKLGSAPANLQRQKYAAEGVRR